MRLSPMPSTKVDLHCHTKYSDRPSEWILRRIGAPESFVEPLDLYKRCRERGMDFVTVSDHNRIEGALDIAHLPGTFISSEITTYFPEDDCKIHCLVVGITEAQFRLINELRTNIYDFQRYLLEEDIIYSVAHPLFRINDRMTVDHLEKLLVMFNRFELINGARDPRASEIVSAVFGNLTPEMIERMADKHDLTPVGPRPWKKLFTGGSDDHSGIYLGGAYTVTPRADSVEHFLSYLRAGRHEEGGSSGTSLRMAHSFYAIGYGYYKSRFLGEGRGADLVGELFRRMLNEKQPQPTGLGERVRSKVRDVASKFIRHSRHKQLSDVERTIVDDFSKLFSEQNELARLNGHTPSISNDEWSFQLASQMSHLIGFSFAQRFLQQAREGRLIESLQTIASLGPIALGIAPYLTAFAAQHKDEQFMQDVAGRFEAAGHLRKKSERKAWLTDTFDDINGVAETIKTVGAIARERQRELTVLTSLADPPETGIDLKNFKPVGQFNLPEYEAQKLSFPPFLEVIEYLERENFSEIIISTPGPMGLIGLAAGRLLGLKVTGIYHTDFPQYVRAFTDDLNMEGMAWRFMHWFFNQMDQIFVPSRYYQNQLTEYGFDAKKLRVMPRGVDMNRFSPDYRDETFWKPFDLEGDFTFLYVGRVSQEKNLEALLDAFLGLREKGVNANLVIVGNGPQQNELKRKYHQKEILFTGYLTGSRLAAAYASADAFVFPSTSDTFGNVVLEAQASGLPAVVTDRGGPQEIIVSGETGFVVDLERPDALTDAMITLADDPELCRQMRDRAIEHARRSGWDQVFESFWREDSRSTDDQAADSVSAATIPPARRNSTPTRCRSTRVV